MCVRYHHTPPGDPHARPRAAPRSWGLAAGFGDGVLGEVLVGHRATGPPAPHLCSHPTLPPPAPACGPPIPLQLADAPLRLGSPSLGCALEIYGAGMKVGYSYIAKCLVRRGLLFLRRTLCCRAENTA